MDYMFTHKNDTAFVTRSFNEKDKDMLTHLLSNAYVFQGDDVIYERLHSLGKTFSFRGEELQNSDWDAEDLRALAINVFMRNILKPILGPCVTKSTMVDNTCMIAYPSDLVPILAGKATVHVVNSSHAQDGGRPLLVLGWAPWTEMYMKDQRKLLCLAEICRSKGLLPKMVRNVHDEMDILHVSLSYTQPSVDKDVYILDMRDVNANFRELLTAGTGKGFLLMYKNDTLPICGNEPASTYHAFLGKASMKFMDVCSFPDCRAVCHHKSAACQTCLSTVCMVCLEMNKGTSKEMYTCPRCTRDAGFFGTSARSKGVEKPFIRKHRFKMCRMVDSSIIYGLESNMFSASTCSNPGCTSSKPKKKYVCPCWKGPVYCSKACQVQHWPEHRKGCWLSRNVSEQGVEDVLSEMGRLTKFLALESFPKIRMSKADDAINVRS
jgi:hypothetical protein